MSTICTRGLSAAFLAAVWVAGAALVTDPGGLIQPAQAQSEEEKKKERERKDKRDRDKRPEGRPQPPQMQPPPQPKAFQAPPPKSSPPPPPAEKAEKRFAPPEKVEKPPAPEEKKDGFRRQPRDPAQPSYKGPPPQRQTSPPPGGPPPLQPYGSPKGPPPAVKMAPQAPPAVKPSDPGSPPRTAKPKRFEDIQKNRLERVEDGGKRKVIEEPGNRFIVKQGNRAIIRHDESERFARKPGARSDKRSDGTTETVFIRPDGVRVVTVVDGSGRLIRRYRRDRDGRERNLIDNRRFYRNLGIGIGVLGIVALNLPPPRVTIPRDRYIVDYDRASEDDLEEALEAPPIEMLERGYSLEEIRDNYELRARMRRVDVDTVTFEFGSFEIEPDQEYKLERIARAMLRVLERNSEAVFMIEGHSDAVGPAEDNLSLSDRRAQAVADVLSDRFGVPEENLVTQGYGEQFLKVDTQGPERLNRRVTILNIAALMAER